MLHLNVPADDEGFCTSFLRKSLWLLLGATAPETLLLACVGQWASTERSMADMQALGYGAGEWTLAHGLYADSGGFLLRTTDYTPFPVTAKQIRCLVKAKHVSIPKIFSISARPTDSPRP